MYIYSIYNKQVEHKSQAKERNKEITSTAPCRAQVSCLQRVTRGFFIMGQCWRLMGYKLDVVFFYTNPIGAWTENMEMDPYVHKALAPIRLPPQSQRLLDHQSHFLGFYWCPNPFLVDQIWSQAWLWWNKKSPKVGIAVALLTAQESWELWFTRELGHVRHLVVGGAWG